jgi:hypothetical protein
MGPYQSQYTDLHFERAGLFQAILDRYPCQEALYPGCSIHITPSLFFPHVVYIDQSEQAARFFAGEPSVLDYINRHKHYRRPAYIRFIRQDYSKPLPLREGAFDLLLALFAGGISRSCKRYIKRGGLLISNNHQNDAREALDDRDFRLIASIKFRSGYYVVTDQGIDDIKIPAQKSYSNALRNTTGGVEYIEHETYYVFKRRSR